MAFFKRNKVLNDDPATGLGNNGNTVGTRYYRKDGSANVRKRGMKLFDRFSWYHTMLEMPRWKFWLSILLIFILVNTIFAFIYLWIGIEKMAGMEKGPFWNQFSEAFFFSAQTFTTVGYGRLNPIGFWSGLVASFEAFLGLLSFALATGLLYGRFSHPQAFLRFSEKALIAPYKDGRALMIRVTPYKNNHLTDVEVKLTLGLRFIEEGKPVNRFYPLVVELAQINTLFLNWTIVHAINEKSAMYQLSADELRNLKAELIVFIKAFDETFSNTVVARSSYAAEEFLFGHRFISMYHQSEDGESTILELDLLNATEEVALPPVKLPSTEYSPGG